ncbi:putative Multidrug resistance efflux pump [uncultured Pleomorphomonas sp.]|uniref:Putative Multidrug resistance efflux pump n=1 Tax=uncultured Pleomorphomonas sp. TaxID=442121 RepID=A0A212L7L6_9HYPH|nr:hypothetical protein [uncultured Pleomorphomonas sp.]SCM73319.1 putative Multidrug resistance efflux pump [uncultured Pleomorphomonas sp.]
MIALASAAWALLSDKMKAAVVLIGGFFIGALLTFLAVTFAYEGLRLPLVGQVIDGRVQTAVKAATAELVSRSEVTALNAQLKEIERQRQVAINAATAARARAEQAQKETTDALAKLDAAVAADAGPDGCAFTDDDLEWLRQH